MRHLFRAAIVLLIVTSFALAAAPASAPATTTAATPPAKWLAGRQQDVVYGRSYGAALTFDIFRPEKPNGAAVIFVVSGGWVSVPEMLDGPIMGAFAGPLTARGYTVFAVCHACQPKFQIPEIVGNLNRAVRFIRMHAADYGIDPNRIGITGGSAGGHLSLMQGINPQPAKPESADPLERVSSKVQAVACFFPPTDFFNYGKEGDNALGVGTLAAFKGAFDFREMSKETHTLERITDEARIKEIGKSISPAYWASVDDPPTLIVHGDADKLVPIYQAQIMIEKLKEAKVPCELIVKPGAGHGWPNIAPDMEKIADWFDQYLKRAD